MVLKLTQEQMVKLGLATTFAAGQFFLYLTLGESPEKPQVKVVFIDEECLVVILDDDVRRLPSDTCIRQIKQLRNKIELLLKEIDEVDGSYHIPDAMPAGEPN